MCACYDERQQIIPCSEVLLIRRCCLLVLAVGLAAGGWLAGDPVAASLLGPEQRVEATDNDASDWFGRAVDIYGDIAVVGAPGDDEEAIGAGAAYVFVRGETSWEQVHKLTAAADAEQFDGFGTDVAVERDLIAVGAPGDDDAGGDAGAVYLFEWDGASWTRIKKLLPDDMSNAGYTYGTAVDIGIAIPDSGSVELTNVVVGAPRADTFQGVVFLVQRSGALWNTLGRFNDSDVGGGNDAGEFGSSVAIRGDNFIGGAPLDDQSGNNTGAAYLFGRTNIVDVWNEVTPLYPTTPSPGDQFGLSVALDENVAVVSAPAPSPSAMPGRVFIYDSSTQELTDGAGTDDYGSSVAIDETLNLILVGARRDPDGGQKAGAVYLLKRDDVGDWQPAGKVLASDTALNKGFGEAVAMRNGFAIVGGSEEAAFTAGAAYLYAVPLFTDGFESGDTSLWSSAVP
jgi:hypothetical protein